MSQFTRRDFTRTAGLATALSYSRVRGANDRVGVGYIGLGNRGDQVHDAFLELGDQQTVAVCDLRADYMDLAVRKSRVSPTRYKEWRKLIEDKNVDAVVIATPDHWHALMMIEACNAGKDVYVEKPLSLTVVEGRKMVETAERTRRVVQVGTNRRSWKSYHEAAAFVRSGGIGHVSVAQGVPHPERVAERTGRRAGRSAAERVGVGPVARAPRPRCPTTPTAVTTTSAGSTITPAGSSPTSACTSST